MDDFHHCSDWLCPVMVAGKRICPNAKGSGIPQVMAAVELANPKEHKKIRSFEFKDYCF
jgi:H+/Cl- antiporter ClcA